MTNHDMIVAIEKLSLKRGDILVIRTGVELTDVEMRQKVREFQRFFDGLPEVRCSAFAFIAPGGDIRDIPPETMEKLGWVRKDAVA